MGVRFNNTYVHSVVTASTKPRSTRTSGSSRRAQNIVDADADDRTDRGRERDRVVLVDDPLPERDREAGDEQPSAPQSERGAGPIGPRRASR